MVNLLLEAPEIHCRTLDPGETDLLAAAARLDQAVWGAVGQGAGTFAARVTNGFVVAALQGEELVGTLSCLRRRFDPVLRTRDDPGHPYATWDGITGRGRFDTAEPDGDALFCVAVTSRRAVSRPFPAVPEGSHPALDLARALVSGRDAHDHTAGRTAREIARACASIHVPRDEVMRFHGRTKGEGLLGGARIVSVLPEGRPEDLPAMGYNVVMAYPDLPACFPVCLHLDHDPSIGEALVLAAVALASRLGVRVAAPYSRPAGFRRALVEALCGASLTPSSPDPLVRAARDFVATWHV